MLVSSKTCFINIIQELDDPTLEASQQADLQRGLSQIRQNGRILPPMMNCKILFQIRVPFTDIIH